MPTKPGKRFPHPTTVELTKTLLLQYAQQVASLGLKQIEVCDKRERGLRAIIYASGRVFFHARYFFAHRSRHKKLGEFGLLTIEQARAANRTVRTMLAQGGDPKQERRGRITLRDFFTQHFTEHCGRKTSFATDISRAKRLLKEFGDLYLTDFDGTPMQSVAKGAVDLGKLQDEAEKKAAEEAAETFKPVLAKLKEALKDKAEDVRVTTRLVDSPACLVVQDQGMSLQLARMLKAAGQTAPEVKPVLEVNAEHPLVKKLDGSVHFNDLAHILFDQALLAEGGLPDDPASYVKRVNALLA